MTSPPSSDLRERLFQVAVAHFRERGYTRVTISQITHETNVAKGTFFNYFPTKDHVLSEVLHRHVNRALGEVAGRGLSGTQAILAFTHTLAFGLGRDRGLAEALVLRLAELPAPQTDEARGALRDEERVRSWIEARLAETLPTSVPLVEPDNGLIAFLVMCALRGTLEEWAREGGEAEALEAASLARIRYVLEASGLPADTG